MSKKYTANVVLGFSVSAALVSAMSGCGSPNGDPTGTATTTSAFTADRDHNHCGDTDDGPRAGHGVSDPGVRGGPPGAGGPIAGLHVHELALFNEGFDLAIEVEATCNGCQDIPAGQPIPPDAPPDTTNSSGLGARFNNNQCMGTCHAQPTVGGTSPAINPSFKAAAAKGATNVVPFFETLDGPTREVRFLFNPDGSRDGGVHQKFSTRGRSDAPLCTLGQPDFEANRGNMIFRIPTPIFGTGLLDSLFDTEILSHMNENAARKAALGIHGTPNHSGNDGTITRFGWKAQNKTLFNFAGEAYNVEMGVTNELDPTQKVEDDNCGLGNHPNDVTRIHDGEDPMDPKDNFNIPVNVEADWMMFAHFMRLSAPPEPAAFSASATRGQDAFNDIGCNECHTPTMQTKAGLVGPATDALNGITFHPYSDMVLHHMGGGLADNVLQGGAGPDQFRSSPLWGVGQRLFFLHDGRANNLVDAILAHYSAPTCAHGNTPAYPASEANQVIVNFSHLPPSRQQDLINFLRAL